MGRYYAVGEIARVLRPGGYLVAWVPAYEFLWSEHDDAVGHRRRYVRGGLERVLEGAGLHVERCAYTMTAVLPAAVGMRLARRLLPRRRALPRKDHVGLPQPVNSLLAHVVGFGGALYGRVPAPFGLSILAVARRPLGPLQPAEGTREA